MGGWGACVECEIFCWAVMVFFRCFMWRVKFQFRSRAQERECAVITNDTTLILQRGQGSGSCLGHVGLGLGLGLLG